MAGSNAVALRIRQALRDLVAFAFGAKLQLGCPEGDALQRGQVVQLAGWVGAHSPKAPPIARGRVLGTGLGVGRGAVGLVGELLQGAIGGSGQRYEAVVGVPFVLRNRIESALCQDGQRPKPTL